ncbi:MAG TPA: hypothetical protein DCF68_12910 [Cyanothece sp. UBA12306]|nr:hypothetical protein [Cyanothece sp. UBA12306]
MILQSFPKVIKTILNPCPKLVLLLTSDIPYLSEDYKRLQVSSNSHQHESHNFKNSEEKRYKKALENGQAILFTYTGPIKREPITKIPENYKILTSIKYPSDGISQKFSGGMLNIAIPSNITNICPK